MNAQPQRCYCDECLTLDKLPVRRQGIPHSYQMLLPSTTDAEQIAWPIVEPYEPKGPRPGHQLTPDALPLFGGLEPQLF